MPVAPRPVEALRLTQDIGGDAVQIFVTNPRGWRPPTPKPREEAEFRARHAELGAWPVVVHAAYLINLASSNDAFAANSIQLLRATLERAALFEAQSVVFHIGSHTGAGEEAGLRRLIAGVDRALDGILDGAPNAPLLLLENDVGGGGKLGARFETIAAVLDALPHHATRLGVCLDTAHLWGAGFDIGSPEGARATLDAADQAFGLHRVSVIHLNDAAAALGSHLDRHARLGEGQIPLDGIGAFLRDPRLSAATVILETPLTTIGDGDIPDDVSASARLTETDWPAERQRLAAARALASLPVS